MSQSESVLYTIDRRVRQVLSETGVNSGYKRAELARDYVPQAFQAVWNRITKDSQTRVILDHTFTPVESQEFYELPAGVREIVAIIREDDQGNIIEERFPESVFGRHGDGWSLEGDQLRLREGFRRAADGVEWTIMWVPEQPAALHYAEDGVMNEDRQNMAISLAPTLGNVDRRVNAYAGSYLRIIPPGNAPIQTRVIESYTYLESSGLWTVKTRNPFDSTLDVDGVSQKYEIIPPFTDAILEAVVAQIAINLAVSVGVSQQKLGRIQLQYTQRLKSATDPLAERQARYGKVIEQKTRDNVPGFHARRRRRVY